MVAFDRYSDVSKLPGNRRVCEAEIGLWKQGEIGRKITPEQTANLLSDIIEEIRASNGLFCGSACDGDYLTLVYVDPSRQKADGRWPLYLYERIDAIRNKYGVLLCRVKIKIATQVRRKADRGAAEGMRSLRPISEARKDGTVIWAVLRVPDEELKVRKDLERWDGVQVPLRHMGVTRDGDDHGWNVAAPVGHGGFPDDWILGWVPALKVPGRGKKT